MVRLGEIDRSLDVFYQPNQLDLEDFDAAWGGRKPRLRPGPRAGRKSDLDDVTFLETKLPTELSARLSVCSMEEARSLFSRYLDPATREAALSNPDPAVRDMGLAGLAHLWSPFFQPRFARDFSVGNGEATLRGKGQNPR